MKKMAFLISVFLCVLSFCSCRGNTQKEASKRVYAMGTVMELKAYGTNAETAIKKAEEEIIRLDKLLSRNIEGSDVDIINKEGEGTVSPDTLSIIETGLNISELTNGAFDMSITPAVDLWGFYTKEYHVPSEAEIAETLEKINYKNISVSENTVFLSNGARLDLGGIAKGYLSGRIMEIFKSCGIKSGLVSLGGNVQTLGVKTDGSLWRVGIRNPEGGIIGTLKASDTAVITSGGYQRFFESGGKIYHHIIDPETGCPAESGLKSVSIVCKDGALADALSTALFVMGPDKGIEFWKSHDGFDVVFMTDSGDIYITEGLSEIFESVFPYTVVCRQD